MVNYDYRKIYSSFTSTCFAVKANADDGTDDNKIKEKIKL